MAAAQLSSMSLAARPVALRAPRASARFGLKPVNARSVTAMYTVTLVTPDGEQVSAVGSVGADAGGARAGAASGVGGGGSGWLCALPGWEGRCRGWCARRRAPGVG